VLISTSHPMLRLSSSAAAQRCKLWL